MSLSETYMIYFRVKTNGIKLHDTIKPLAQEILNKINGSQVINLSSDNDHLFIFWDDNKRTLIFHVYADGLVTLDLQNYISETQNNAESSEFEVIRSIEELITKSFNSDEMYSLLVPIKRGGKVWPYVATSDRRLAETDYEKCVFHKKSKYQTIDIMKSKSCGNCLLLDGDLMIADSDLIYTHTLTGINRGVDYKDKIVLILGGGDGGTLYELLKLGENKPKFIWMAEIDEDVVKACRDNLKGVCYDALDSYEGPNHKILFENCLDTLKRFNEQKVHIDYVINDLTEYPVSKEVTGYNYDFHTCFTLMELSLKLLKPTGRLFARGNCIGAKEYFDEWEENVKKLNATFKRYEVFVPSYLESAYVLYEIIPKQT